MGFCERKGVECYCYNQYCEEGNCHRLLPDTTKVDIPKFKPKNIEFGVLDLNSITGVVDAETDGKKFAIGTKNQATGFVLNFGNRSCLLFTGDVMPIDLRQFNFDEFESIEINGNKFVRA